MTFLARDFMQPDPIAVSPETPLLAVHRLFVEEEINGAPVVDDDGTVLGVISSLDLVRAIHDQYEGDIPAVPAYFRQDVEHDGLAALAMLPGDLEDRIRELTAIDVAVPEIVWVRPDTPLPEVARAMREQRVHRVLVAEEGRLLGIVTTFDLLRLIENGKAADEVELRHGIH